MNMTINSFLENTVVIASTCFTPSCLCWVESLSSLISWASLSPTAAACFSGSSPWLEGGDPWIEWVIATEFEARCLLWDAFRVARRCSIKSYSPTTRP